MSYFSSVAERVERLGLPIPKGLHKFLGVGLVGLIVHTGLFTLLYKLNVQHSFAWLVGLLVATSITWTLNRKHTFQSSGRKAHDEAFRYAIVTIASQTVSYLVFHGLEELAKFLPPPLDVIVGAACATVISYAGQRFFTFAPHKDKAETPPQ